jgi:hypothetical protein
MLGPAKCDDVSYAELLQHVTVTHELPGRIESASLREMIAHGVGVVDVPGEGKLIAELLRSGRTVPALSFDLTFPEVFYPNGVPFGREGFHAVLGNPPWEAIQFKSKEFFAAFDFEILVHPGEARAGKAGVYGDREPSNG